MTFVLKAILEQTYMFYPMANFVNCFSFVFRFGKKKKEKKRNSDKALCTKLPYTRYPLSNHPVFNHVFILSPVQKPHELVIEISKSDY